MQLAVEAFQVLRTFSPSVGMSIHKTMSLTRLQTQWFQDPTMYAAEVAIKLSLKFYSKPGRCLILVCLTLPTLMSPT